MAELVRPKKPKNKKAENSTPPPIPDRPTVINGVKLPDVPQHNPSFVSQRERSKSPEPEEQSDFEEEEAENNGVGKDSTTPMRPAPAPPKTQEPPPIPQRSMIFPRSVSLTAESNQDVQPVLPQKSSLATIPQYPIVPELSELPSYTDALSHPTFYPSISSKSIESESTFPEKSRFSAPPEIATKHPDAPPLYPSIRAFEKNEHGLMTESELLAFYHNPLYEHADAFVDRFIESEEIPANPGSLFPLLKRFKEICDLMVISQVKIKENSEELQKCQSECWKMENFTIDAKGKCGENHDGTGRGTYRSYVLQPSVLQQMKKLLAVNRTNLMDRTLCEETIFRSLALQIQWEIIAINNGFMLENGLNLHSPPLLVADSPITPARAALRAALSDLFYHLRFPRLQPRYIDTITGWIKELTCVLKMKQSCDDGLFLLCHLLRLPSPIHSWAAPLVQTFQIAPTPSKLKIDYALALLTHLLNPIRARETFLRHVAQSEREESAWEILDDDDGDADEFSFVTITEIDLIAFLEQISISEIYSMANFSTYSNKVSQITATIAFQLLLMKILDNGLTNYAKPGFKSFCKHIGISLKNSVREMCSSWNLMKNFLLPNEEIDLQKEVDRIILLALNYLIHRDSVGLFQFVVNLPYDMVSEECRNRCEFALRSNTKMGIKEIYDTPICEIQARIKTYSIKARVELLQSQDCEFLINSLASIGSSSNSDVRELLKELVDVCFCDESTRNNLYKCGGEGIGQILTKRPDSLHQLLTIIDRNLSHMDTYAINVLSSSRLLECKLTEPMMSLIGKWLINNPPEHGGNRLARRVLSGLHWGLAEDGQDLWISAEIHAIAADTIVKAHSVHCSRSNSMISKSLKQIQKLASKVGDSEAHFQQFCWDLLVKLKLAKNEATSIQNDLTAHYVKIVQVYEHNITEYLEKGVTLLSDLVSSGSSVASVVLLCRLIAQHYKEVNSLSLDKNFMSTFERILHVDQLPYAVQWFSGPSAAPTPIVKLICSSISYYATRVSHVRDFLRAWLQLLCSARSGWNQDAVTYQIVGSIARIAFINDPHCLYDLPSILQQVYTKQLADEKNASKGLFSVFSADTIPSPLIPDSMLVISPMASYLMLLGEQHSFGLFYSSLFENLVKKDKYSLEDALRKVKSSMVLPVERLAVFRWAKLVTYAKDHVILPAILQQLTIEAYKLRKVNNAKLCFARKLLDCAQAKPIMLECRKAIEDSRIETRGLCRAVTGWLFTTHEVTRTGFDFSVFDLYYLLKSVLDGETNVWTDFVNVTALSGEEFGEQRVYSVTCQLGAKQALPLSYCVGSPRSASNVQPFAVLPVHSELPQAPVVDVMGIGNWRVIRQQVQPLLTAVCGFAKDYNTCGDRIEEDDQVYCELIKKLYQSAQQMIAVEIRCSSCSKSNACTMPVNANVLNSATDVEMTQNRNKRIEKWNELNTKLMNKAAMTIASIEYLGRMVARMIGGLAAQQRAASQESGKQFYYLLTSSCDEEVLLFFPASDAFRHTLRVLGEVFVRMRSEEQMTIMKLVLQGFPIPEPLVEVFTPEVLNATDLCAVYRTLSESVRMPEKSKMALQLLGRLGMQQAAANLPPHQFAALLPIAFANLTSQPDPSSQLHILCLQHVVFFIFHQFPSNIINGLELALEGCNTSSTPNSLLDAIVEKLEARDFLKPKREFDFGARQALELGNLVAKRLDEARKKLPNFYGVWGRYMEPITRLVQLFIYIPIRDGYQTNHSVDVLQRELYEYFGQIVMVFSPLIAPYSPAHPPFTPTHETNAELVLDRFVELLAALPYNSSIPPGMQNVQALVWRYYSEKLSILSHGTEHYYDMLERQLIRLKWQTFWPSKLAITTMENCLRSQSKDCASFISQIFARIPWNTILQQMGDDVRPGYMASLFGVIVRLVAVPRNYDKVRASLLEIIKSLSIRTDWNLVGSEEIEIIANAVSVSLPSDSVSSPSAIISVVQLIWRKMCCFSASESFSQEALKKQTIWLKTECVLLLKCDVSQTAAGYNSLILDVNSLAVNHPDLCAFKNVARELTALWKNITDNSLGESLVSLWNEYLAANPSSPLVIMSTNTLIESLNSDQMTTALKVLEKTLLTYFLRSDSTWTEITQWISFPKSSYSSIEQYLLNVPNSVNKMQFLPLTLKVFMDYDCADENKFFSLHKYILNIKPKHVINEAAFVSLLARLVQWISARTRYLPNSFSPSDDLLSPLLRWLSKSTKDDSSFLSNLISSKKTAHSQKLRTILYILELYLTQQTLGEGKRPRSDSNSPVLNSRITALKTAAQAKANLPMSAAFNKATCYFIQVDTHQIMSASPMLLEISRCIFGDRFLTDV